MDKEFGLSLLSHSTENLGDDIQALAALKMIKKPTSFIDRDWPAKFAGSGPSFLIANGWFAHFYKGLFLPDNFTPFYISFHLRNAAFLTPELVGYLKRHEPIGCRDLHTQALLNAKGISAYFSGCLTLTLGAAAPFSRDSHIVIADLIPRFREAIPRSVWADAIHLSHNTRVAFANGMGLTTHFAKQAVETVNRLCLSPNRTLACIGGAIYQVLTQGIGSGHSERVQTRLGNAQAMLYLYSRAKLVVTSRLHVALPCMAFGTPVLFFHPNSKDPRFTGLLGLLKPIDVASFRWEEWSRHVQRDSVAQWAQALMQICQEAIALRGNPFTGGRNESLLKSLEAAQQPFLSDETTQRLAA